MKLEKSPSFWVIGQKCPFLLATLLRYEDRSSVQLGLQVNSINHSPFFFMSPLLIKVVDQMSIGTDVREPVLHEAIEEVGSQFHGSSAVGVFTSGPVTALFPHENYEQARECFQNERAEPKPEVESKSLEIPFSRFLALVFAKNNMRQRLRWELSTIKVLEMLKGFGLPLLRFRTYFEASELCGLDETTLRG